ncbi:MAG: nucleotide exchange factor GrpE [Prevotellaceae bacterium]|jgi:molecular chaperone GrpE|nr:nucleotide exchange factor GrpE [Prevotellaceae bacterium]
MNKKDLNEEMEINEKDESTNSEGATNLQDQLENASEEGEQPDKVADSFEALKEKYDSLNDSHVRLMAEFDNYRKRTLREKSDLIKTGSASALTNLLPVIDDFERALQNIQTADTIEAVTEGVNLIYNKFMAYLSKQGVKAMDVTGKPLDSEISEAVAIIPAPENDQKGKVLDCVQTGYTLFDKVIRHAKVVVGE